MMEEHPVQQPISRILVANGNEGLVEVGAYEPEGFAVGYDGVTRIEACQKSGMHANIPYVRVWAGEVCLAEFCQHNIVGVYFAPASATAEFVEVFNPDMDAAPHDATLMGRREDGSEVAMLWWHSWPGWRESIVGGGVGEPVKPVAWRPLTKAEYDAHDDIPF